MDAQAEATLKYEWGDADGSKLTVSGSASASDDN